MAVDFYGNCKGTDGDKYDVWLNITHNLYDKKLNTSNFTVSFYVKRNDSVSDSAYNSFENENSVELIINGEVIVNKNLSVDTRNCAVVELASWTGDIEYDENGEVTFTVEGNFTMNSKELASGSVQAFYKNSLTPKATTLILDSFVISPGSVINAEFDYSSSEYSHRIAWGLGEQSVSVNYAPGQISASFEVPVEWAEQIKNSQKGDFKVAVRTYHNSITVGTNVYTLEFVVPQTDEFKPDFEISLKKIDTDVPEDWNVWVQGISKMEVVPENLSFKYGAALSAITITVGSVSKRSLPAVFDLTEKGNVLVTVAVRDSRGLLTVKRITIEVEAYNAPSVDIKQLTRCLSDGTSSTSGESLFMDYIVGYSAVKDNNSCTIFVKYRPTDYGIFSEDIPVTVQPFIFGDGNIKNNKSYIVSITVFDDINKTGIEIVRLIPNGDIPFNIRKGGNGAAFGKYARNENELSVKWDLSVDGNLDFKGHLKYEQVECECTPLTENLLSDVRYYPCLGMVFLRLRFTTTMPFSANDTYYLATIKGRKPGLFMPLNSMADFESGGQSTSGITYETGVVVFRSDAVIPQGTTIYISGFYVADYSE